MPIEGKVAKIIDESSLVVNLGRRHGVREGVFFVIYALGDEEVRDPDTGKSLGTLEVVKGYVQAVHVQEELAICCATLAAGPSEGVESAGVQTLSGAMMAEAMGLKAGAPRKGGLNVDLSQMSGVVKAGPISIGDCVRSIERER